LVFLTIIISCKKTNQKLNDIKKTKPSTLNVSKNFFDFDEVIHYEYLRDDVHLDGFGKKHKEYSGDNILKRDLIIGHNENLMPKGTTDTLFIQKLEIIGFKKNNIDKKNNIELNRIFSTKVSELIYSSCFPFYRDILIFKKNNRTIGMVKICFECGQSIFYGEKNNTEYFGENNEYEELLRILNNNNNNK
jgi:hypothetical protein